MKSVRLPRGKCDAGSFRCSYVARASCSWEIRNKASPATARKCTVIYHCALTILSRGAPLCGLLVYTPLAPTLVVSRFGSPPKSTGLNFNTAVM